MTLSVAMAIPTTSTCIGLASPPSSALADLGWFPLEEDQEYWKPAKLYWTTWGRERTRKLSEVLGRRTRSKRKPTNIRWRTQRGFPDEEISADG